MSALTDKEKARIIELRSKGKIIREIAKEIGRAQSAVANVIAVREGRTQPSPDFRPPRPPLWQLRCKRCLECGRKMLLPCRACAADKAREAKKQEAEITIRPPSRRSVIRACVKCGERKLRTAFKPHLLVCLACCRVGQR